MDALEAILTRRSVATVSKERPSQEEIVRLLNAAVRAPTHHLTEPWRFVVLTGPALGKLGKAMAERVLNEGGDELRLKARARLEQARPLRAPVIVTVVYVPSSHPQAVEMEDRYSVGAAMQNLLIAAHAEGLAAHLRTGVAASDPGVRKLLGIKQGEEIAAFVYLGYPLHPTAPPTRRTPATERTTWLGWS